MEPAHAHNLLYVTRYDFRQATKVFARKRLALGPVLMAFENGFLSFESGGVAGVMHAEGDWQGRATFSPEILRALATVPPDADPIPIAYADGHILIGGMTILCQWSLPSRSLPTKSRTPVWSICWHSTARSHAPKSEAANWASTFAAPERRPNVASGTQLRS